MMLETLVLLMISGRITSVMLKLSLLATHLRLESYAPKLPTIDELVKFDGVVIRDGVRGANDGELYCIWNITGLILVKKS